MLSPAMSRVPVSLRMLVLLPLLAAGVDLTRATAACGAQAQTCLEAAGRGWLGVAAVLLVVAYAAGTGLLVARGARPSASGRVPGFARLWALATVGLFVAATGQDVLAQALGGQAALGGSPLGVLGLCAAGGALLALALRTARDAAELVADLSPRAPRALLLLAAAVRGGTARPAYVPATVRGTRRGRAPPHR